MEVNSARREADTVARSFVKESRLVGKGMRVRSWAAGDGRKRRCFKKSDEEDW